MAFELRELLGQPAEIMVVSESDWFQFVPSNPWVAVNWRKPEDVKVHLPQVFAKLGIGFRPVGAKRSRSGEERRSSSATAERIAYDYLVIATGPKLAFDEIEGLGPQANTSSICHVDHAATRARALGGVLQEPRPDGRRRRAGRLLLRPGL